MTQDEIGGSIEVNEIELQDKSDPNLPFERANSDLIGGDKQKQKKID